MSQENVEIAERLNDFNRGETAPTLELLGEKAGHPAGPIHARNRRRIDPT
jgi:hypothetical protein